MCWNLLQGIWGYAGLKGETAKPQPCDGKPVNHFPLILNTPVIDNTLGRILPKSSLPFKAYSAYSDFGGGGWLRASKKPLKNGSVLSVSLSVWVFVFLSNYLLFILSLIITNYFYLITAYPITIIVQPDN